MSFSDTVREASAPMKRCLLGPLKWRGSGLQTTPFFMAVSSRATGGGQNDSGESQTHTLGLSRKAGQHLPHAWEQRLHRSMARWEARSAAPTQTGCAEKEGEDWVPKVSKTAMMPAAETAPGLS